jgi:hypothetical protein
MAYIVHDEQQTGATKAAGMDVDYCFAPGGGSSWSWAASAPGGRNATGVASDPAAAQEAAIEAARRLGATGSAVRAVPSGGVYWGSVRGPASAVKSSRPAHRTAGKRSPQKARTVKAASPALAKAAVVGAVREPSRADLVYDELYREWRDSPDPTARLAAEAYLAKSYGQSGVPADPRVLAQVRADQYHNDPNVRLTAERVLSMRGVA